VTMRRAGKPGPRLLPEAARSYAEDTVFGTCENPGCSRHARAACAACGGEYCLSHTEHPAHDASAEAR
jgi:hypothetical protein